ncbi:hypothetical protein MIMGU_mgv1a024224mg [Erythranthe guttata]|uniref:Acetolactate synthase n=1 Tax=Erythranthe guttata TaxID=4155 RepID=A0A022QZC7_ERYGU|nr:hypothetical protein MIMGU_mgv1a024224mg [Erythranthe guttata]
MLQFGSDELRRQGSDVLVEALKREGVRTVFAYPGASSMEIHQSISRSGLITNVLPHHDIPHIVKEAFFVAKSGRLGPILIDVPKDIQKKMVVPDWNQPMQLGGYISTLPGPPNETRLKEIIALISLSTKPVLYVGGGCLNSSAELRRFVDLTGISVTTTLMGLGCYPGSDVDELALKMLGMHGTMYANYAVDMSDLLLAFGLETFATREKIVHIDIGSSEIGKNKKPHVSICANIKLALQGFNKILNAEKQAKIHADIPPQYAIEVLEELTNGDAIITTGVGQHQMWAAQFYKYNMPRQWLTSGGFGAMGFGLPAAIRAALARPNARYVVDIDGDGSFLMNIQELATLRVQNLPFKIMLLNNQHLGMVVQLKDRFNKSNRADTFIGNPTNKLKIFPDMTKFAESCGFPAARVKDKENVRGAIKKMLDTPGPYLLDIMVPHEEHVLPMIPSYGAFEDAINE